MRGGFSMVVLEMIRERLLDVEEPLLDDPDPKATAARPGTWEKVEVMRGRLERGERLFHPGDARL